ncbi:MAG: hypothetical protein K6G73_04140 [Marinilabiliaceae bacterium]|nr:hypothetical protein [Bacteroidales bacterium]MCR5696152.1 hypothetical protein [Marinilabiliaceae bacterium]
MKIILLSVLILIPQILMGQSFDGSIEADAAVGVSPRWTLQGKTTLSLESAKVDCAWGRVAVGAKFNFYSKYSLLAMCSYGYAAYRHLDNRDIQAYICEGIDINNSQSINQQIYFEHWRINYKPSGVHSVASGLTYAMKFDKKLGELSPWSVTSRFSLSTNIDSDDARNSFLRRIRIGAGLKRNIKNSISAELFYGYMLAGEHQIYMGDMQNLHIIKLYIHIDKKYSK